MREMDAITAIDRDSGETVAITDTMRFQARRVHEDIIHHGNRSAEHMAAVAEALRQMRDQQLYLALGHTSFADYCETDLDISPQWANAQIQAASVLASIRNPGFQSIGVSHLRLLARLPQEQRQEFIESNPVAGMTKRELEEAVREANRLRREAEQARQEAAAAKADAERLANQPPQVVERVLADPRQLAEIERLNRSLKETEADLERLRQQADQDGLLSQKIRQKEQKIRELEERARRMGACFDDEQRDPNGGQRLTAVIQPLQSLILSVIGDVRIVKQAGAGGPCDDDQVKELADRLDQLSAMLRSILNDRRQRPINIEYTEVQ